MMITLRSCGPSIVTFIRHHGAGSAIWSCTMKVGDLVTSRRAGWLAVIVELLGANRVRVVWADTLESDEGGASSFRRVLCK